MRPRALRWARIAAGVLGAAAALLAVLLGALLIPASSPKRPRPGAFQAAVVPIGRTPSRRHLVRDASRAENAAIRRLLALGLPVYCGGHRGHDVAFTFDDGPGPYTRIALKKLRNARESATFFVVGRSINNYPGYLPRELKVAALGDHSFTHPPLVQLSPVQIAWQLEATLDKIEAGTGVRVELFRPPYGLRNDIVDKIAKRLGLLDVLWDVDSQDSLGANWAKIIKNVEAGLHPGAIIELHENRGQTIRALTTLLPVLRRRHLRSVTIPQLLTADPPSDAQLRRGPAGCLGGGRLSTARAE